MHFVPEGQQDSSQVRSAWVAIQKDRRPGGTVEVIVSPLSVPEILLLRLPVSPLPRTFHHMKSAPRLKRLCEPLGAADTPKWQNALCISPFCGVSPEESGGRRTVSALRVHISTKYAG
jgi:hypothetical protein